MITNALSFPKRYKEIMLDQKVKSYHEIVPVPPPQVVDGANRGDREEHDSKGKEEKVDSSCKL